MSKNFKQYTPNQTTIDAMNSYADIDSFFSQGDVTGLFNYLTSNAIKSNLREVHKLKRENLVLSDNRHSMYLKLRKFDSTTLGFSDTFLEVLKISERIGKNGNKIQRLRTNISQLKKVLIPAVDE